MNVEHVLRSCSLEAQFQQRAPCKEEAPLKDIGLGSSAHSATVQTHGQDVAWRNEGHHCSFLGGTLPSQKSSWQLACGVSTWPANSAATAINDRIGYGTIEEQSLPTSTQTQRRRQRPFLTKRLQKTTGMATCRCLSIAPVLHFLAKWERRTRTEHLLTGGRPLLQNDVLVTLGWNLEWCLPAR